MMAFEDWAGTLEQEMPFSFVQYGKKLLPVNAPNEIVEQFCRQFPAFVQLITAGQKEGRLPKPHSVLSGAEFGGWRFYKLRISGNWRAIFFADGGTLTVVCVENHDRNITRLRRWCRGVHGDPGSVARRAGYVTKPLGEFLRFVYAMQEDEKSCTVRQFRTVFNEETDFNLDTKQQNAVDLQMRKNVHDIVVIGNAGSGKSTVGMVWLESQPFVKKCRLYLTMSRPLVEEYSRCHKEQNDWRAERGIPLRPEIRYVTVFDYLKEIAGLLSEKEVRFLDPEESYREFRRVYERTRLKKEDVYRYWREIHGLVKGAVYDRDDITPGESRIHYPLDQASYEKSRYYHLAGHLRGEGCQGRVLPIKEIFRLYKMYEQHLESQGYKDDNDLAVYIYNNMERIRNVELFQEAELAFVDECQDLTENQMLTVFNLLSSCEQRLVASDRCQIVRPTYYDTGFMQQILEATTGAGHQGKTRKQTLNYNYRSGEKIIALQNLLVERLKDFLTLSCEEREPVQPGQDEEMGRRDSVKPVWVYDTPENEKALRALVNELPEGAIVPIFAQPHSSHQEDLDIVACKGLTLTSVLLWNIFRDVSNSVTEQDPMAWDFFYVGITRAERFLFILEPEDSKAGTFLRNLPQGALEVCRDMRQPRPRKESSWSDYIAEQLKGISLEELIQQAYDLYKNKNYLQAGKIFREHAESSEEYREMEACCYARFAAEEQQYEEALLQYGSLERLNDEARDGLEELLENMLEPRLALAARLMLMPDEEMNDDGYYDPGSLNKLFDEYRRQAGKDMDVNEQLQALGTSHPLVRRKINAWLGVTAARLDDRINRLDEILKSV